MCVWTGSQLSHVYLNGDAEKRYPGNLNLSFAYVEGESLLMGLKDVAVSSGSACTSASLEPSYVTPPPLISPLSPQISPFKTNNVCRVSCGCACFLPS